jgi:pimeloyl-ACP methyl ester carboxylesterase
MQKKPTDLGVRVCRYDRSGIGTMGKILSERAPNKPRTNLDMANDLYRLLTNANIDGPYIMVGHSMGAWIIRLFTDQHPEDVVGMVLVDGGHPDSIDSIVNLIPPVTEDEGKIMTEFRDYYTRLLEEPLLTEEYWDVVTSAEQLRAVDPLGDIPLVVLSRDTNNRESQYALLSSNFQQYGGEFPIDLFNQLEDDWVVKIEELAGLSTNSNLVIVEGSSHLLPYRQSETVIAAIQWVLEQVRE